MLYPSELQAPHVVAATRSPTGERKPSSGVSGTVGRGKGPLKAGRGVPDRSREHHLAPALGGILELDGDPPIVFDLAGPPRAPDQSGGDEGHSEITPFLVHCEGAEDLRTLQYLIGMPR